MRRGSLLIGSDGCGFRGDLPGFECLSYCMKPLSVSFPYFIYISNLYDMTSRAISRGPDQESGEQTNEFTNEIHWLRHPMLSLLILFLRVFLPGHPGKLRFLYAYLRTKI
jgi:hypothetical protein